MKKVLIIFVCVLMSPIVSYAACLQAQSGEFEFSECLFQGQNFTSAAKSFWGDPKVDSSVALSNKGDTKDFVLYSVYQCGYCKAELKDQSKPFGASNIVMKFVRPDAKLRKFRGNCSGMTLNKNPAVADDEMMIAYIAKDISAHGAEFCLTQISGATWDHPEYFIYYQMAGALYKDSKISKHLGCMWFCEPGWDGDRCEKQGIPDTMPYRDVNPKTGFDYFNSDLKVWDEGKAYTNIFQVPECDDCTSAVHSIAVLDYKKTGKQQHCDASSCWDAPSYQQEIVVGATQFKDHGIVARPILLGASGGHHPCYYPQQHKVNDSQDLNKRNFLTGATSILSKFADGGSEHVLCLQGYTKNANCDSYAGIADAPVCDYYKSKPYDSTKHYKRYSTTNNNNCLKYECINGMTYSPEDNYACSYCKETAFQGLCSKDKTCTKCSAGQCVDSTGCGCTECGAVLTKSMMKSGKNQNDKCWGLLATDDFQSCVLGIKKTDDEDYD